MTIDLNNVAFGYPRKGTGVRTVFSGFSLGVRRGESVGIIGPEGAGKTTLLQLMAGLQKPGNGIVLLEGNDIWRNQEILQELRRKIGYTFQFPEQQFFAETVEDELTYALKNYGLYDQASAQRCLHTLELVGLNPKEFLGRSPFSLSVGEARRLAFACVLVLEPRIFLLDEPTAGLDAHGTEFVIQSLNSMREQGGTTIVLASHDVDILAECTSRVIILEEGKAVQDATTVEVLTNEELLEGHGYSLPDVVRELNILRNQGYSIPREIVQFKKAAEILRAFSLPGATPPR